MKICPVGAGLFHADRHDEANSHNFANAPKNGMKHYQYGYGS